MELCAALEKLLSKCGVHSIHSIDSDFWNELVMEESKITTQSGMAMDNRALGECAERDSKLCMFVDSDYILPTDTVLFMMDSKDNIIGQSVSKEESAKYHGRDDVVWLSEDFVIFPSQHSEGEVRFVMMPIFCDEWNEFGSGGKPVMFFPAMTTDIMMKNHFNVDPNSKLASAILAFNIE